ncbi:MAG: inorganic phosphate transporter [Thermoplasmata archaeon]
MEIDYILVLILSLIISGNNSSLILGPLRSSGIMRGFFASIFVASFISLGFILEGEKMLISISIITFGNIVPLYILVSTLIIFILFSIFSVPLSAGMVFSGALMGFALYYKTLNAFIWIIFLSWIVSFLISILISYYIYKKFSKRRRNILNSKYSIIFFIFSSAMLSYSLGANTFGFLYAIDRGFSSFIAIILGVFIGTIFFNYITYSTVKKSIVRLTRERAIVTNFSSFFVLESFTQFHLPVSITQNVIGSLVGTGISKGYNELNLRKVNQLIFSWAVTPLISAIFVMVMIRISLIL